MRLRIVKAVVIMSTFYLRVVEEYSILTTVPWLPTIGIFGRQNMRLAQVEPLDKFFAEARATNII